MVVGGALLVARRDASELLAPIDEPLNAVSEAVDASIERPGATLVRLTRDGEPYPMLAGILPNAPAAIPLVPDHPAGTVFGTARAVPLHRPVLESCGKDEGLVPLSRCQHQGEQLAIAIRSQVYLGAEPALAAP